MANAIPKSPEQARQHFPRRSFKKQMGVLCDGVYFVCQGIQVGEGGMSFLSDYVFTEGHRIVVSFHIPGGDFVFIRAVITSSKKEPGGDQVSHAITFDDVAFSVKRQIRAYVSFREN